MKITIYSTVTCPYCKMLKSYLDEKKVSYEEKLVDQDDAAREEMVALSGGYLGVPYTVIEKAAGLEASGPEGGEKEKIIGFDKGKLNSVLGLE